MKHNNQLILGELKDEDSNEPLLRAVLEIETYRQTILNDKNAVKRFMNNYLPADADTLELKTAVMLFDIKNPKDGKYSRPWKQFTRLKVDYPEVRELMKSLQVEIFVVREIGEAMPEDKHYYSERKYSLERLSL